MHYVRIAMLAALAATSVHAQSVTADSAPSGTKPGDWVLPGRTYGGTRFSPLSTIDTVAWETPAILATSRWVIR